MHSGTVTAFHQVHNPCSVLDYKKKYWFLPSEPPPPPPGKAPLLSGSLCQTNVIRNDELSCPFQVRSFLFAQPAGASAFILHVRIYLHLCGVARLKHCPLRLAVSFRKLPGERSAWLFLCGSTSEAQKQDSEAERDGQRWARRKAKFSHILLDLTG